MRKIDRGYRWFTLGDDFELARLAEQGSSLVEIGEVMGRSKGSVQSACRRLGVKTTGRGGRPYPSRRA